MRILIAPNAFKHSLNAEEVALAIKQGLMESMVDCDCECFPIGDGGEITGFDSALEKADLVITGEGSIDEQTLQGKGPFGVACSAKRKSLAVIALAGKVPMERNIHLQKYFDVLLPIANQPTNLSTALATTAANPVRTSAALGNLLAILKYDHGRAK